MNQIFYSELKEKCREIEQDFDNSKKIEEVITAYDRIIDLSNIARKEGLLELEESVLRFEEKSNTDIYLKKLIMLVVDGTEPALIEEAGINTEIANCMKAYDGLVILMYLYGALMIQGSYNPRVIDELLKSIIPGNVRIELEKRIEHRDSFNQEVITNEKLVMRYTDENDVVDPKDYSVIGQLAATLVRLDDNSIQRLLREIECTDLAFAMKAMKGQARKRIFDNMSDRLALMVAENMDFMGPVRMKDVEDRAIFILKKYIDCVDMCEIKDENVAAVKLILDIHDSNEKYSEELKERYKDIKKIIDKIYT